MPTHRHACPIGRLLSNGADVTQTASELAFRRELGNGKAYAKAGASFGSCFN